MAADDEILTTVHRFFVESRAFNGIPATALARAAGLAWDVIRDQLGRLVASRDADLTFASVSENLHIKRLPDLPAERQVQLLNQQDPGNICVYPSAKSLILGQDRHAIQF